MPTVDSQNDQYLFHEQLLSEWLVLLNMSKQQRRLKDLLMQSSWFFFELLFKSVSFYLNSATNCLSNKNTNQFKAYKSPKLSLNTFCTKFLSLKFISDLERLINLIITELITMQQRPQGLETNRLSSLLNCSLAFFLLDLISIIDRGFIFRTIDFYFKETNKSLGTFSNLILQVKKSNAQSVRVTQNNDLMNNFKTIHSLQLDFLRILSSHEHFIALNLPIFFDQSFSKCQEKPVNPKRYIIESNDYFYKHFPIGLVLRQMFKSLHSSLASVQLKAVQILRNIIEANDIDPRMTKVSRAHIAYMYMPFLNMFIHFIPLMAKKMKQIDQEDQEDLTDPNTEDLEKMKLNEQIFDINLFKDISGDGAIPNEFDFYETSLNLDEFDVDLDQNEFFNFDDILNEDFSETVDKYSKNQTNTSFINVSNNNPGGTGLKNFRKISQQITKIDQFQKKAKSGQQQSPLKAEFKKPTCKLMNKSKPCCDLYNLRLNFLLQENNVDSTSIFTIETTQNLLICFIWILKNMDKKLLFSIWKQWSSIKLKKLLLLFDLCINHFEYRSTIWSDFMSSNSAAVCDDSKKSAPAPKATNAQVKLKQKAFVPILNSSRSNKPKVDYLFFKRAKYFKYTDSTVDLLLYDLNDCVSSLKKYSGGGFSKNDSNSMEDVLSYSDKNTLEGKNQLFLIYKKPVDFFRF